MTGIEARLEALERQVRESADTIAIYQLIATYGPAVDSMAVPTVRDMWVADGAYDAGGFEPFHGERVALHLYDETHQGYLAHGALHVMSLPFIILSGDTAVATNYSRVYEYNGETWDVVRAGSNRWELARTDGGWKVTTRINRLLNGEQEPMELLARGLADLPSSAR